MEKTSFLYKNRKTVANLCFIAVLFAGIMLLEAFVDSTSMWFSVLRKVATFSLAAVSMNLLNGFTGLFSLGQAGFMLVGAYTYAMFTIPSEFKSTVFRNYGDSIIGFCLPILVAVVLAGVVAAIFAYLIGLPVLRLKSDYLAIATLGFAEIIKTIVQSADLGFLTNGPDPLSNFNVLQGIMPYVIIAAVCITVIVLLINSTYGRAFKAIRDDEVAAEAMGINLAKHKQMSFVISSFFAGIAGAMLAMCNTTVSATTYTTTMTYEILLVVVIGGVGSITGSIIAAFLFYGSSEWWLRFLDVETTIGGFKVPLLRYGFRMVVFSIIIMIVVLFFRKGIMGTRELSVIGVYEKIKRLFTKKKAGKGGGSDE